MIVPPEKFYAAFLGAADSQSMELQRCYHQAAAYTKVVRKNLLHEIANSLGLQVYASDYYTLDAIFYSERDTERFPDATYAKRIAVAFEHENDSKRSHEEMNKLQLFNASLKVLVTYASKATGEQRKLLDMYASIVSEGDLFNDFATLRRQLVIFGEAGPQAPRWSGFTWTGREFVPLDALPS